MVILAALGTWQVNRLIWKEQLISRVESRLESKSIELSELIDSGFDKTLHEYQPVRAVGSFDHSKEVYFFATGKQGSSGWNVHTPLTMANGKTLIVNRGFVPFEIKDPVLRTRGQIGGNQIVTGLLRFPLFEKPFGSIENDLDKREFFWRNVAEMSNAMQVDRANVLPVILDADDTPVPGGLPIGDTTIIAFPNNHLQYAITWYGLMLTLIGVGGYFIWSRRKTNEEVQ
ncbi:MAG: SURF1 family protein [Pseudomonadota bacterium]